MRRKKNTVLQLQDTDRLALILEDLAARGERQVGNALRRLNIYSQDPFDTPELKPYEEPVQDYQDEQEEDFVKPTQQSPKSSSPNNPRSWGAIEQEAREQGARVAGYEMLAGMYPLIDAITPKSPTLKALSIGGVMLAKLFKDVGILNWASNYWNFFGENKNKAEIKASQGNVLRAREKQQYLESVQKFQDNNSQLLGLHELLSQKPEQYKEISEEMAKLLNENYELLPELSKASTYKYDTYINDPTTRNGMSNRGPLEDEIKDAIKLFLNFQWDGVPDKQVIDKFKHNIYKTSEGVFKFNNYVENTLVPLMSKDIEQDSKDLQRYHTDDWFRQRAESAQRTLSFTDLDTYLYGMSGVLGSSASNNGLQYLSQAFKLGAAGATLTGVGAPLAIPMTIAGLATGIYSGQAENNAEVADHYMDSFTKKLDKRIPGKNSTYLQEFIKEMSDDPNNPDDLETAFNKFVLNPNKVKNQEIQRIAASLLLGLNNLFQNDMAAVVGSEILETSISLAVPLGGKIIQNATKPGIGFGIKRALVDFAQRNPKLGSAAKFAARATGEVEPGTPFSMGWDLTKGTLKTAARKPINAINRKFGRAILSRSKTAMEDPGLYLARTDAAKKTIGALWAQAGLGFSEAIEEGKQHQYGDAYQRGEFDGDYQKWFDLLQNDISAEARGATSFISQFIPGMESDPELLAEMRGGFLAPFGNAMTLVNMYSRLGDIPTEMRMDHLAANTVLSNKINDRLAIQNAIQYSKAARDYDAFNYLERAFSKMKDLSRQLQEIEGEDYDGFTVEEIEEQRKRFHNTVATTLDPRVIAAAKERGIELGTEDYDTYAALITYGKELVKDANAKVENVQEAIDQVVENVGITKEEFDLMQRAPINTVSDMLSNAGLTVDLQQTVSSVVTDPMDSRFNQIVDEKQDVDVSSLDEELLDDESLKVRYRLAAQREITKMQNQISNFAYLQALLARIEALEQLPYRTHQLDKQLGYFKSTLIEAKRKFGLVGVDTQEDLDKLINVRWKKDIDDLQLLYETRLIHEADVDQAIRFINTLKGVSDVEFGILENDAVKGIVNRIHDEAKQSTQAINKTIKARTRKILDQYKKSVREDQQYVQYLYDAFEDQKNSIIEQREKIEREIEAEELLESPEISIKPAAEEEAPESIPPAQPEEAPKVTPPPAQESQKKKGTKQYIEPLLSTTDRKDVIDELKKKFGIVDEVLPEVTPEEQAKLAAEAEAEKKTPPSQPSSDPRERTLQALRQIRLDNESTIKTGRDYFINEGGTTKRYPRVHSVKSSMYPDVDKQLGVAKLIEELNGLYNSDKQQFKARVLELQNKYNDALATRYGKDSDIYKRNVIDISKYLEDGLIDDAGIVSQIANMVYYKTMNNGDPILNVAKRSVIAGDINDDIARNVLSGKEVQYDPKYGMPEEIFNRFVDQLKQQKQAYERDGWTIVTDPIVWHGTVDYDGEPAQVAGETDMLLVDKDGNIKLVDFKTSKKAFVPVYKWSEQTAAGIPIEKTSNNKEDVPDGVEVTVSYPALDERSKGAVFTAREDYTTQLATFYSQLINQMLSHLEGSPHVVGIELLPTEVKHRPGKNALGHTDNTVFGGFASSEEKVDDDLWNKTDYIVLRDPIQIQPIAEQAPQLPPQVTQAPEVKLDTLNGQIKRIRELKQLLQNAVDANKDKLTVSVVKALDRLKHDNEEIAKRVKSFMDDAAQRSNSDTLSALEEDLEKYIHRLESAIDVINNLQPKVADTLTLQDFARFVARSYTWKVDMTNTTHIQWHFITEGENPPSYAAELARVTALPDFLENATFEIDIPSWKRSRTSKSAQFVDYIIIRYTENKADGTTIHHQFGGNGTRFVPILIQEKDNGVPIQRQNVLLVRDVDALINDPANKGKRIFIKPAGRTNGVWNKPGYGGKMQNAITAFGITDENIKTIIEGNEQGILGISQKGQVRQLSRSTTKYGQVIHGFSASNDVVDGIMYYTMYMGYTEDGSNIEAHKIPIPLTPKQFTPSDVELIVDCLRNHGKKRVISVNGKQVQSPLSNNKILTLLVRFGDQSEKTKNRFQFMYAKDDNGIPNYNVVLLGGIKIGEDQFSEVKPYDLRVPTQVEALKLELARLSVYYNNEPVLLQRTSTPTKEHKLAGLAEFFKKNPDIDEIKFSDSVVFTRKDVDPDGDGSYKGTTVAQWMLRSGWMQTTYNGVSMPHIVFDGAFVETNPKADVKDAEGPIAPGPGLQEPEQVSSSVEEFVRQWEQQSDDLFGGLSKRQEGKAIQPLNESEARARIAKILGKDFPVDVVKGFINKEHGVVGRMRIASIILSTSAEHGTEFHEAFHAVLEFLVGEKRRKRIYQHYRNKYGKGKNLTDELVTEGLADLYMEFRNGIKASDSHQLIDTFRLVIRWVNAIYDLHDFKLARLFVETSLGLYSSDAKLFSRRVKNAFDDESIRLFRERFSKDYLDYDYTTRSGNKVRLKHFANFNLFSDSVQQLLFAIIQRSGIDPLANNISKFHTDKDSIIKTLGNNYDILTANKLSDSDIQQLPLEIRRDVLRNRELFELWDDCTRDIINDTLESFGLHHRKIREQQKMEDKNAGQSAVGEDIEGHSDDFWSRSRSEGVSAGIQYMLSTIPSYRFATSQDVLNGEVDFKGNKITSVVTTDKHGNEVRPLVPTKRNSLGTAAFMSFDEVYQTLLKRLYNVKDVQDLDRQLILASKDSFMFYRVAMLFHKLYMRSYVRYTEGNVRGIPKVMVGGMLLHPSHYVKDVTKPTPLEMFPTKIVAVHDLEINGEVIHQGDIIPNALIITDPDAESLVTQFFQSIKSQKLDFRFTYVNTYVDSNGTEHPGQFTYNSDNTNIEQARLNYPHEWFDNLRSLIGTTLTDPTSMHGVSPMNSARIRLSDLINKITEKGSKLFRLDGRIYSYDTTEGYDRAVTEFVGALNTIGISIDRQMFTYMLIQKYPNVNIRTAFLDYVSTIGGVLKFIEKGGVLDQLHTTLDKNDTSLFLVDRKSDKRKGITPSGSYLYANSQFIMDLATWYGRYMAASKEMRVLGPGNTDMYMFAENHTASDIVDQLNNSYVDEHGVIYDSELLDDLVYQRKGSKTPVFYNSYVVGEDRENVDEPDEWSGRRIGSVMIKALMTPGYTEEHKIELSTDAGIKSDQKSDAGRKYTESTEREDYLSKCDLLSSGYIVFPTLSDKSTWFFLRGIFLPGLKWDKGVLIDIDTDLLPVIGQKNKMWFSTEDLDETNPGYKQNDYLDQLIEYAKCDYASAMFVEQQIKNKQIPEGREVKSFHTGNKQGARLGFILGIYNEKGLFVSFNNNKRQPSEDLIEAYSYFFRKSLAEQREIMARTVQKRLEEELAYLEKLGIITSDHIEGSKFPKMWSYKNKYLDAQKIEQLKNAYRSKPVPGGKTLAEFLGGLKSVNNIDAVLESLAIVAYVNDINIRSNMSLQETQRIFTGMPQGFKWVYDEETGELLNVRDDESKRYGGLGSTGTNNRIDLPNIETEYSCAEIEDWKIGSPLFEELEKAFKRSELQQAVVTKRLNERISKVPLLERQSVEEEIYDAVYRSNLTDDQMIEELGDLAEVVLKNAENNALSYKEDIDVADGTAFITDKMAENLLRQRGVYTKSVAKAFDYLRRKRTADKDYLSDADAYRVIHEALISTQKYSAFGFRKEFGMPIHFYNKFALFPLFDGMAYGLTHDLYLKMLQDGVDMVMFSSAVKVGSEGAQRFDPDMTSEEVEQFSFKGHVYKQKYSFIRRQLNTDPREEEDMAMGTQASKIALSVLRDGQLYSNGLRGSELKARIMGNINKLARYGNDHLRMQFLKPDGSLDLRKFANFVRSELLKRNADKNLLDALEIVSDKDEEGNVIEGTERFAVNLNAVSNMQWIESIITSKINSEIIDINLPGNAYYQRSVFGMERLPKLHGLSDDEIQQYTINDGKPLQMINSEGSMDAVISIDYFMHIIPKDIRYDFVKARQWLLDNHIIGNSDDVHANTMAYRIPTQSPASVCAIRFVDVIPIVRDTIIFPKEFTKITGSDFKRY